MPPGRSPAAGRAGRPGAIDVSPALTGIRGARAKEVRAELKRIEDRLREMHARLHDPAVSLPQRMRINLTRVELEAYARGIRFAAGDVEDSPAGSG